MIIIIITASFVQVSLLHSVGKHTLILGTVWPFFQQVRNKLGGLSCNLDNYMTGTEMRVRRKCMRIHSINL